MFLSGLIDILDEEQKVVLFDMASDRVIERTNKKELQNNNLMQWLEVKKIVAGHCELIVSV